MRNQTRQRELNAAPFKTCSGIFLGELWGCCQWSRIPGCLWPFYLGYTTLLKAGVREGVAKEPIAPALLRIGGWIESTGRAIVMTGVSEQTTVALTIQQSALFSDAFSSAMCRERMESLERM